MKKQKNAVSLSLLPFKKEEKNVQPSEPHKTSLTKHLIFRAEEVFSPRSDNDS